MTYKLSNQPSWAKNDGVGLGMFGLNRFLDWGIKFNQSSVALERFDGLINWFF